MRRPKQAFTLVELLVVIAIIGVLVALLLPAVQAARESARRNQCANNIKQITLAVHNYADAHRGALPVGEYACCLGTWLVGLLPYIEQQNLYEQYRFFGALDGNGGNPDPATRYGGALNLPVTRTQLKSYNCPSDQKSLSLPFAVVLRITTTLPTTVTRRCSGKPHSALPAPACRISSAARHSPMSALPTPFRRSCGWQRSSMA